MNALNYFIEVWPWIGLAAFTILLLQAALYVIGVSGRAFFGKSAEEKLRDTIVDEAMVAYRERLFDEDWYIHDAAVEYQTFLDGKEASVE